MLSTVGLIIDIVIIVSLLIFTIIGIIRFCFRKKARGM